MPLREGGQDSSYVDDLIAKGAEGLANGPGGGPGTGLSLSPDELIGALLEETSQELLPSSGFRWGQEDLPSWFPETLRPLIQHTPGMEQAYSPETLKANYDPYLGLRAQAGDERVYMGDKPDPDYQAKVNDDIARDAKQGRMADMLGDEREVTSDDPKKKIKRRQDRTITLEQAINRPYLWDEEQIESTMKRMRQAGFQVTDFDQLTQVWGGLVDRSMKMYTLSAGKNKVTPWDVLELSKREAMSAGTFTDFESGSKTTTARSVTEISEGAAWRTLQTTLSTLLGRDPTDQELRDYTYRMNNLAAKNPSITETITKFRGGEAVSQTSSTSGGFDADDMAQEAYEGAQDDPEYAKVQAGTTLWNALTQALGAVGDV